ncbi:2-(hydroxymethyl)glutarate dehydrogenase [bacterium HR40]|nr:2-(hydroxymethyl)glutarate dehydrogenase [bacterium HR40]
MPRETAAVAVIGLGAMGGPMAKNLLRAGFRVRGYDLSPAACRALAEAGGEPAPSPAAAAREAELLHVVVASADQVEAALFGEDGAVAGLPRGSVVLLHSTVPPRFARDLAARLSSTGHPLLDAPISGGRVRAEAGTLTVMASGPAAAFAAAERALAAIAAKVFRLGEEAGIGSSVKMINQLLAGVHIAAACEAMALAVRAGVDPDRVYEVIRESAGNSWMFENRVPHILARDFTPLSAVDIFVKDLGIVLDAGREWRFPLPLAAAAHQQYLAAAAMGLGRDDDSSVVRVYERLAGIEVRGRRRDEAQGR